MNTVKNPDTSKIMQNLRILGLALVVGVTSFVMETPAIAQTEAPSITLDDTLRAVRDERRTVSEANRQREARFVSERNQQQAALNRIRGEVRSAEAEAARLEQVRNDNERALSELKAQLAERQGEFGELFGAARAAAADLNEQLNYSLISAQFPGRGESLVEVAQSDSLPTIEQLEDLWFTMLQEITEQSKVVTFNAGVIGTDNKPERREVTRIGPFTASSGGNFVLYDGGSLKYLARQPGGEANRAARRVENHTGDGYVAGVIDPSLGVLLGISVESPTFMERVEQGGTIGYAIIVIGILGSLLALYRWVVLTLVSRKVSAQMRSQTPSANNPLGRVMLAYEENKSADIETVQLKLDEAVVKELPSLEAGLNLVKVLAAVAPLMGLLGTVIGMIVTFQAITMFGTGDPKLMAGGISMALVTTVQGLLAAIPLLLLHALASSASRRVMQVLEQQSAGMVAELAERAR